MSRHLDGGDARGQDKTLVVTVHHHEHACCLALMHAVLI